MGTISPLKGAGLSHVVDAKISVVSTKARRAARRDLLSPKAAALQPGFADEKTLDRAVDPTKMARPPVASAT
jgi:hypothetical protein